MNVFLQFRLLSPVEKKNKIKLFVLKLTNKKCVHVHVPVQRDGHVLCEAEQINTCPYNKCKERERQQLHYYSVHVLAVQNSVQQKSRARSPIPIPIKCMSQALQLMLAAAVRWIDIPTPSVPVEVMASRDSLSALSDLFQSARPL